LVSCFEPEVDRQISLINLVFALDHHAGFITNHTLFQLCDVRKRSFTDGNYVGMETARFLSIKMPGLGRVGDVALRKGILRATGRPGQLFETKRASRLLCPTHHRVKRISRGRF
jgi:hypothetical protein